MLPKPLSRSVKHSDYFMSEPTLNRIVRLLKKTGDRAIVMPEGEEPYVIMSFDAYEKLVARDQETAHDFVSEASDTNVSVPHEFPGSDESTRLYIEPVEAN